MKLEWQLREPGVWGATGEYLGWLITRERGRLRRPYRLEIVFRQPPRWWLWTLKAAQARAEEIDKSATIPTDKGVEWWPVVRTEGPDARPVDPQPSTVPETVRVCWACGSAAPPVLMKPVSFTFSWWDDPTATWCCPACDGWRGDHLRASVGG